MSLLKRRSRSETRRIDVENVQIEKNAREKALTNRQLKKDEGQAIVGRQCDFLPGINRRKTSAELITEAKLFLGEIGGANGNANTTSTVGGVRLVKTRRPITPREPGRVLYGKVALAGRPPSAFSLRYLQGESNRLPKTPPLEPIKNAPNATSFEGNSHEKGSNSSGLVKFSRSSSLGSRGDFFESVNKSEAANQRAGGQNKPHSRKLPSLNLNKTELCADDLYETNNEENASNERKNISQNLNCNQVGNRKILTKRNDLLAQSSTEKLIELLKEHSGLKECTEETVNHVNGILLELFDRVYKSEKNYKRAFILGGLYGLVECSSSKILLAVARVVLALRVTGSNLTGACKLIFKVARNEKNDHLFYDNNLLELLIDGLGRASPLEDPEACIYGYGSIRFLTSSSGQERNTTDASTGKDINKNWSEQCMELPRKPSTAPPAISENKAKVELLQQERIQKLSKQTSLVERLAKHGGVDLMVLHLQILNEAGATQKLTGPPLHSLYQLSAALRAFADVQQIKCSYERELNRGIDDSGKCIQLELACPHLIRATEVTIGELEVQANLIRTLSALSEDNDCCHTLASFAARIGMLLGSLCEMFNESTEKLLSVLCRLGYILGNIMAKHDPARIQFYHNDVAMEYLITVLERYANEPLNVSNATSGDTVVDVLVKMIRVVANMSVNTEVGFGLGNARALGTIHVQLLRNFNGLKPNELAGMEELIYATLGSLHNLCFYQDKTVTPTQVLETDDSIQNNIYDITTILCSMLRSNADESTQLEAARVLGNLTRNENARKSFANANSLPLIVQRLSQDPCKDIDMIACCTGVLVNLLGDSEHRQPFLQLEGTRVLTELLENILKTGDWFMATIICQAFWNLLNETTNDKMTILPSEEELDDMGDLLADYLDDDRLFKNCKQIDPQWEDFAIVATDLLERIQSNYDRNEGNLESVEILNNNDKEDEDDVQIEEL